MWTRRVSKPLWGCSDLRVEASIEMGGLKNRSPAEIVCALLAIGNTGILLHNLRARMPEFEKTLSGCVPEGKGIPLIWNEGNPMQVATEIFVRFKLQSLRIGVYKGGMWPKPCPGVLQFMAGLQRKGVEIGILSSGHELFIKESFRLWECKNPPKYILTDDDLRGLDMPLIQRTKPSPYLFDLFFDRFGLKVLREEAMYFGDDPWKDGMMADAAGIPFGWYNPSGKPLEPKLKKPELIFRSWSELVVS
jgi:phosphoglycolate phosphatase-like HAD superfamily hydrolase